MSHVCGTECARSVGGWRYHDDVRTPEALTHTYGFEPYAVNTDAVPRIPEGWTLESHRPGGMVVLDRAPELEFWQSKAQENGRKIPSAEFWKLIRDLPYLNAQVMYLLINNKKLLASSRPVLGDGRHKRLIFPGTVYRDRMGQRTLPSMTRDVIGSGWLEAGEYDTEFGPDQFVVLLR